MKLKCLIFDDEPSAIVELSFLLGKYVPNWEISGFSSEINLCKKLLEQHSPDLIFCDIHFGKEIVFDDLPELKSFNGDIVFITGDNGYATQAFELSAVNYFLKPVNEEKFHTFLTAYASSKESKSDVLKSKFYTII